MPCCRCPLALATSLALLSAGACDSSVSTVEDSGPIDSSSDAGRERCTTPESCLEIACAEAPFCTACDGACDRECETCERGRCVARDEASECTSGLCWSGQCCAGCWDGTLCRTGDETTACGSFGMSCEMCFGSAPMCAPDGCAAPSQVFADADHSCVLSATGVMACVGANANSELGLGDDDGRRELTQVASTLTPLTQAVFGDGFGCFLARSGRFGCSGANNFGQLGLGDFADRAELEVFAGDTRFRQLDAGNTHTCGITIDGRLSCWGNNFFGGLGNAGTASEGSPVRVGSESDWRDISAGDQHTCGIREEGSLWCWGWNAFGQVGDGTATNRPVPTRLDGVYRDVSCAAGHSCAVRTDGSLWCWGRNTDGQIGVVDNPGPIRVPTRVGERSDWVRVEVGLDRSCAVDVTGELYCWGENSRGQLGVDREDDLVRNPTRLELISVNALGIGRSHSCATDGSGVHWCFGDNRNGQLGLDERQALSLTPVRLE